jgi:hypothetical protein
MRRHYVPMLVCLYYCTPQSTHAVVAGGLDMCLLVPRWTCPPSCLANGTVAVAAYMPEDLPTYIA